MMPQGEMQQQVIKISSKALFHGIIKGKIKLDEGSAV